MIITLSFIFLFGFTVFAFIQQPMFGKMPSGKRLDKIKQSPNYKNGAFQNLNFTPVMSEDANYFKIFKNFFISKSKRSKPTSAIPSTKTDLLNLDASKDIFVWLGHSSYFMQIDGKKILVDPVLSGSASPVSFTMKAFNGTNPFTSDDIPEIDYLFITHDHWDHLDYKTILELKSKIKKIICPLGVGEHFEFWGFDNNLIIEKDWNETIPLDNSFKAHTVPARHFSGRTFIRNKSLWTAFVLETPTMKIFIGGDSGYDTHFSEIGEKFGPFDLAILENGQYNENWKYIHSLPDQVLLEAKDLKAKHIIPVHSAKFALALHDWDEPLKKITFFNETHNLSILTPLIGLQVNLKDTNYSFSQWWKDLQ